MWDEHLWGGRSVAQRGVRPDRVVVPPPTHKDDLGLPQAVKDLAVEKFVPEPGVEAPDVAVLPRRAQGDVGGLGAHGLDPVLLTLSDELWPVVRADVARHAAQDEQVREDVDHVIGLEFVGHTDGQALMGEPVYDVEHAELAAAMRPVLHEVAGLDVVGMLGPQTDAGVAG